MKLFSFTGWSGSGKTTLISKLISELSGRGYKIMAVKKVPEKYDLEPEGKDSRVFFDSGAETVFLVASNQLLRMSRIDKPDDFFKIIKKEFNNFDFIFLEGLINSGVPVFEVYDSSVSPALKNDPDDITVLFGDKNKFNKIKYIDRNNIKKIADLIEKF